MQRRSPPAFQAFANDCELIRGTPKYTLQKHVAEDKPLNYFLLDQDALDILKMIYSDSTRRELMDCKSVMEDFFGSVNLGKTVMDRLSDDEWKELNQEDDDE